MAGYECPSCSKAIDTEQGLKTHYSRVHSGTYPPALTDQLVTGEEYECPICDRIFETKHGLKTHRAQVHDAVSFDARSV